jgi:hypothetical protein
MPNDIYSPGTGTGSALVVAGLIWMALRSAKIQHSKRGRLDTRFTLEKWSLGLVSAWGVLIGGGLMLMATSPQVIVP